MKKLTLSLCAGIFAIIFCAGILAADVDSTTPKNTTVNEVITDEVIVSLFNGTIDEWLDNSGGMLLDITTLEGKTAMTHMEQDSGISLKRKFTADLSKYSLDELVIITDIYINGIISEDCNGTLKIKNGDGADFENSSENNQFNFEVSKLGLKKGWNHLELNLKDAVPDGGDNYKIADWFCMWINDNFEMVEISIGKLDIVKRTTKFVAVETPVTEVSAPEETVAQAITEAPESAVIAPVEAPVEAPETADTVSIIIGMLVISAGTGIILSKKRIK